MRTSTLTAWIGCCWLLAVCGAAAAQAPKIGVVDLERLLHESPQARRAKEHMAARFAARKRELQSETTALRQAIDELNADENSLDDAAIAARRAVIKQRRARLQNKQNAYNDDVAAAERKELARMRSDILDVIHAYAKDHGFDLILGDSPLYAADSVDVTDAVLARLNER